MCKRVIVLIISATITYAGLVSNTSAAVVSTQQALSLDERQALINKVSNELLRQDVEQAMVQLGVDPKQAQLRVASLNNQEIAELDRHINSLPAGGSILALVGAVFVVLLILDLTGVTDVFTSA